MGLVPKPGWRGSEMPVEPAHPRKIFQGVCYELFRASGGPIFGAEFS
jgi:hypothetical protein